MAADVSLCVRGGWHAVRVERPQPGVNPVINGLPMSWLVG
jgi:hypothetical protein